MEVKIVFFDFINSLDIFNFFRIKKFGKPYLRLPKHGLIEFNAIPTDVYYLNDNINFIYNTLLKQKEVKIIEEERGKSVNILKNLFQIIENKRKNEKRIYNSTFWYIDSIFLYQNNSEKDLNYILDTLRNYNSTIILVIDNAQYLYDFRKLRIFLNIIENLNNVKTIQIINSKYFRVNEEEKNIIYI